MKILVFQLGFVDEGSREFAVFTLLNHPKTLVLGTMRRLIIGSEVYFREPHILAVNQIIPLIQPDPLILYLLQCQRRLERVRPRQVIFSFLLKCIEDSLRAIAPNDIAVVLPQNANVVIFVLLIELVLIPRLHHTLLLSQEQRLRGRLVRLTVFLLQIIFIKIPDRQLRASVGHCLSMPLLKVLQVIGTRLFAQGTGKDICTDRVEVLESGRQLLLRIAYP